MTDFELLAGQIPSTPYLATSGTTFTQEIINYRGTVLVVARVRYDCVSLFKAELVRFCRTNNLSKKDLQEEIDLDDGHVNAQPLCADVPWHIGGFSTETEEVEVTSI